MSKQKVISKWDLMEKSSWGEAELYSSKGTAAIQP